MTVKDDFLDKTLSTGDVLPASYLAGIRELLDPLDRTAAEIAAGVTPVNYQYPEGNVRRYGAKGDGTTDDSAAFAAAESIGKIIMDEGTFNLGSTGLTVTVSSLAMKGAGFGATTLLYTGTGVAINAPDFLELSTFEDFDLNLVGASGESVVGMHFVEAQRDNELRRVRVRNSPGGGIIIEDPSWGVRLENVLVEFCAGIGVFLDEASGTELHACTIRSNDVDLLIRKGFGFSVFGGVIEKGTTTSILIEGARAVLLSAPRTEGTDNQIVITRADDGTRAQSITVLKPYSVGATGGGSGAQIVVDYADDVVIEDSTHFSTVSTAFGVRVTANAGRTRIINPRSLSDIDRYDVTEATNTLVMSYDDDRVLAIESYGGGGPELYLRNLVVSASTGLTAGVTLGRSGRRVRLFSESQGTFGRTPDLVIAAEADGGGLVERARIKNGGAIQLPEISDPGNSPANTGRIYMRDDGSGKTQFVAVFPSGAVQVIATEP